VKIERGPPVEATTAVTSTVSSRQISHEMLRGRVSGSRSRSALEVTTTASSARARMARLVPGRRSPGSAGPSRSRSAATPSRAHEKPRSSLFESTTFIHG
jgi:hypothetical protein